MSMAPRTHWLRLLIFVALAAAFFAAGLWADGHVLNAPTDTTESLRGKPSVAGARYTTQITRSFIVTVTLGLSVPISQGETITISSGQVTVK